LIDGNVECFARNVIKRNINCALRSQKNTPAFEILASVKFLPYPPDLHGILADQKLTKVLQRSDDCQFPTTQPSFAESVNPLIGLNFDDELIPGPYPNG